MRILLTTYGSYGDLHPYLAMAKVLAAAGHTCAIATHEDYRVNVERLGVEHLAMRPSMADVGPESEWATRASNPYRGTDFIVRTMILPYVADSYRVLSAAAPRFDLIISHLLTTAVPTVSEVCNIPYLLAVLQPSSFFSSHEPPLLALPPGLPTLSKWLGPGSIDLVVRLMKRASWNWFDPLVELRRELGLSTTFDHPLLRSFSPYGNLALFSEAFAPPQRDWPANTTITGFPLFDADEAAHPSPPVEEFLQRGEPPIVFTLGSAVVLMDGDFFNKAYQAVKQLGVRALFIAGKDTKNIPAAARIDERVCVTAYEPYSKIFPRAKAIVHQCGIGTTAQALASGRPQICVPYANDQPDNAARVAKLGCSVVLPARKLNVPRLIDAIRRAEQLTRCGSVATQVRNEHFAERLLAAVDKLV